MKLGFVAELVYKRYTQAAGWIGIYFQLSDFVEVCLRGCRRIVFATAFKCRIASGETVSHGEIKEAVRKLREFAPGGLHGGGPGEPDRRGRSLVMHHGSDQERQVYFGQGVKRNPVPGGIPPVASTNVEKLAILIVKLARRGPFVPDGRQRIGQLTDR